MVEIGIQIAKPVIEKTSTYNSPLGIWFWIAFFEFCLIVLMTISSKRKKKDLAFSEFGRNDLNFDKIKDIDMADVVNNINHSRDLYKELARRCHPDRFVNQAEQQQAEQLFQEITKSKHDYEELQKLKIKACHILKLNF